MPLGRFLEERVFKPLKMADSGFFVEKDKLGRVAEALPGWPVKLLDVTAAPKNDSGGAGGVSTAADYLRFSQMLLNGGQLDGARVLSRTTVGLMASDHLAKITVGVTPTPSPGELLLGTPGYTFGLGFAVRQGAGVPGTPGGTRTRPARPQRTHAPSREPTTETRTEAREPGRPRKRAAAATTRPRTRTRPRAARTQRVTRPSGTPAASGGAAARPA